MGKVGRYEVKLEETGVINKPAGVRLPFTGDTEVEIIQQRLLGAVNRTFFVA